MESSSHIFEKMLKRNGPNCNNGFFKICTIKKKEKFPFPKKKHFSTMSACQDSFVLHVNQKLRKRPLDTKQWVASDENLRKLIPLLPQFEGQLCSDFIPRTFISKMLTNASNPYANLPILFSSTSYVSPNTISLNAPPLPAAMASCATYWVGVFLSAEPILRAQSCLGNNKFEFYDQWFQSSSTQVWTSGLTKTLIVQLVGSVRRIRMYQAGQAMETLGVGFDAKDVIALELSGDESTSFLWSTVTGWSRYNSMTESWEVLTFGDARYIYMQHFKFSTSFDGSNVGVLSDGNMNDGAVTQVYYKLGTSPTRVVTILNPQRASSHMAILNSTFFVTHGRSLYALRVVGELAETLRIGEELDATEVFTGIWADNRAVWAATATSTYMSSDNGWSWTLMLYKRAVGPGLFLGGGMVLAANPTTLKEDLRYPLVLSDSGLLTVPIVGGTWQSGFELKTGTQSAFMNESDGVVVSPNGLFLMTQSQNRDIMLYYNVWNSLEMRKYCATQQGSVNICKSGYTEYCEAIGNVDPGCGCINQTAEAQRLFDFTNVPEPTRAKLEDVAPCVSRRCIIQSNRDAYPFNSLGAKCAVPLVLCTSHINDDGNIGGNVRIENNCGVNNAIPCHEGCPVGLKCFGQSCRLQCDGKCDDPLSTCFEGACIPKNEVPSAGNDTLTTGLMIGASVLVVALVVYFLLRKKPKLTL
jgi:hypothetical protein